MTDKFQNIYRIKSARHPNWDYGSNAAYFVTVCTKNRQHYFGVCSTTMQLSEIGEIAHRYWIEIPNHFPFVKLDAFVVMPNHVHGILIISGNNAVETPKLGVSTKPGGKNPKWNPGNLGVILNQYKRICTINARKIHADYGWQSRFHDHIIRDNDEFERIRQYIINNPLNWKNDDFF